MKTVRALARYGALFGAAVLLAHGDGGSSASPPPAQQSSAAPTPAKVSPTGPWLIWSPPVRPETGDAPEWNGATGGAVGEGGSAESADPENAERIAEETYAMNQAKQQQEQPEQTLEQTAKQQAYDQDWMLRSYTDELKKRHLEKADYTNPYLLPDPLEAEKSSLADDPLLNPPEKKKDKPDAASTDLDHDALTPKKGLVSLTFQPLLGAFPSTEAAARPDASGSLTDDGALNSGATLLPVPNVRPADNITGSSDGSVASLLDVPGLTAASQGGIAPNNAIDFDDSGSAASNHARTDNFLAPTAPGSDVSEFFKKQAEALAPPTAPGVLPTVVLPPKPRVFINLEPTAKPAVSGLRAHVDDPFDILQR